jgi:hypothetical protein
VTIKKGIFSTRNCGDDHTHNYLCHVKLIFNNEEKEETLAYPEEAPLLVSRYIGSLQGKFSEQVLKTMLGHIRKIIAIFDHQGTKSGGPHTLEKMRHNVKCGRTIGVDAKELGGNREHE